MSYNRIIIRRDLSVIRICYFGCRPQKTVRNVGSFVLGSCLLHFKDFANLSVLKNKYWQFSIGTVNWVTWSLGHWMLDLDHWPGLLSKTHSLFGAVYKSHNTRSFIHSFTSSGTILISKTATVAEMVAASFARCSHRVTCIGPEYNKASA